MKNTTLNGEPDEKFDTRYLTDVKWEQNLPNDRQMASQNGAIFH